MGLSIFSLLALLLIGASSVVILVVVLKGNREEGAPPARANRIGCIVFALLTLGVVLFLARGRSEEQEIGVEQITVITNGAEIFRDDVAIGIGSAVIGVGEDGAHRFPPNTSPEEIARSFYPDAEALLVSEGSSAGVGSRDRLLLVHPSEVHITTVGGGALDSFVILRRLDLPPGASAAPIPPSTEDVLAWVIRVRKGSDRHARLSGASAAAGGRTFLQKLLNVKSASRFEVSIDAVPTPWSVATKPAYVIDRFPPPEGEK